MGNAKQGGVYVCRWSALADETYRGVVARPKFGVIGDTLSDLVEPLTDRIAESTGDCEPVIEFGPPVVDAGRADWFRDGIVSVAPNAHFNFDGTDRLTERGFCTRCKCPLGARTTSPISIRSHWPGEALFSWNKAACGVKVLLLSERLLAALSPAERGAFETRPVSMPKGKRKQFFEIVPKRFVSEVPLGVGEASGWHCRTCGRTRFHSDAVAWGAHLIARDSLPDTPTFFVGTSTDYTLCLSSDCW